MIFIVLGSQKFQFNRLLKKIDYLIENDLIDDKFVFAQIGYSDYVPKYYRYTSFLSRDEFIGIISRADLVITHGGTGAIITAIKMGKKVIAIPRLSKYGEHVDDHQLQIISQFKELNLIYGLENFDELPEALSSIKNHKFSKYHSNTKRILKDLQDYIGGILNG